MKYNTKHLSKLQEKRIAKDINGKVTIASGSLDFQKADVRNDKFLVEAKTTEKNYYPLNIKTWDRINNQAINDGLRIPIMCIDLEDGKDSLVVISSLDLWGLVPEGVVTYVDNPIARQGKTSIRLTTNFLHEDFTKDIKPNQMYYRKENINLGNRQLCVLSWSDFLSILLLID